MRSATWYARYGVIPVTASRDAVRPFEYGRPVSEMTMFSFRFLFFMVSPRPRLPRSGGTPDPLLALGTLHSPPSRLQQEVGELPVALKRLRPIVDEHHLGLPGQ